MIARMHGDFAQVKKSLSQFLIIVHRYCTVSRGKVNNKLKIIFESTFLGKCLKSGVNSSLMLDKLAEFKI